MMKLRTMIFGMLLALMVVPAYAAGTAAGSGASSSGGTGFGAAKGTSGQIAPNGNQTSQNGVPGVPPSGTPNSGGVPAPNPSLPAGQQPSVTGVNSGANGTAVCGGVGQPVCAGAGVTTPCATINTTTTMPNGTVNGMPNTTTGTTPCLEGQVNAPVLPNAAVK